MTQHYSRFRSNANFLKRFHVTISLFLISVMGFGQASNKGQTFADSHTKTWEDFVTFLTENEEWEEEEEWIVDIDELEELYQHPIDVNTASKQDLLAIVFLSEKQIDDIREYVEKHHGIKTLYELSLIPSIDFTTRSFLPLFLKIDDNPSSYAQPDSKINIFTDTHHELISRVAIPLYYREGHMRKDGYRGSPLYNKTKYTFSSTSHFSASLHAERDAGERGIDSYGGHITLRNTGNIETLVLGDYKVSFGEGLAINQGFSLSKSTRFTAPRQGIRASSGTDEINYLRGIGATLRWNTGIRLSAFLSRREMDATLQGDSCAKTILKTGYHRTASEWERKGNIVFSTGGANLSWNNKAWKFGASTSHLHTSLPLIKGSELYRQIAPEGQDFTYISTQYGFQTYRIYLHGETAYCPQQNGIATLNTIDWRATHQYAFHLTQRYYDKNYYSFYSRSISENANVQNETGMTLRMEASLTDGLTFDTYLDFFFNSWPRYGLSHSSSGYEWGTFVTYDVNRNHQLSARYNLKSKEVSKGQQTHHRFHLQWAGQVAPKWNLQTTLLLHSLKGSTGEAISETVRYAASKRTPLNIAATATYFHSKDFDSRLYLYEPNVGQAFYIPSLYGHGLRLSTRIQWSMWKSRARLEIKYAYLQYLDGRETQSTGLQKIYSNAKNDITIQIRLKI